MVDIRGKDITGCDGCGDTIYENDVVYCYKCRENMYKEISLLKLTIEMQERIIDRNRG